MKYIDHGTHLEMIPENEADIERLEREYPHLCPFDSVCQQYPQPRPPDLAAEWLARRQTGS